jgi:hypothetical protein
MLTFLLERAMGEGYTQKNNKARSISHQMIKNDCSPKKMITWVGLNWTMRAARGVKLLNKGYLSLAIGDAALPVGHGCL